MLHHKDHGLRLVRHDAEDCGPAAAFIRARFLNDHGAHLHNLMPQLFSLLRANNDIVAAFGLRSATCERLFMERYLDEPVECRIARLWGHDVARDRIIEVGNLAAHPGGARAMIEALTHHLHETGIEWVTFTGVLTLRHAFRRLGLRPLAIAAAVPDRLSESERALWGRYFDGSPIVMAGYVPHGYRVLAQRRASRWNEAATLESAGAAAP